MNTDDPKFTAHALGDIDDLTPAERAEIAALLASDADADADAAETRALAARLRTELQSEQSAPLTAGQRAAVLAANVVPISFHEVGEEKLTATQRPRPWRVLVPLALAASVALCASLAWKTAFPPPQPEGHNSTFAAQDAPTAPPAPDDLAAPHPEPEGLAMKAEAMPLAPAPTGAKPVAQEVHRTPTMESLVQAEVRGAPTVESLVQTDPVASAPAPDMPRLAKKAASVSDLLSETGSLQAKSAVAASQEPQPFTAPKLAALSPSAPLLPERVGGRAGSAKALAAVKVPAKPGAIAYNETRTRGAVPSEASANYERRFSVGRTTADPAAGASAETTLAKAYSYEYREVEADAVRLQRSTPGLKLLSDLASNRSDPETAESYDFIPDNAFLTVAQAPLSTFSIDVDTASYAIVRRFLNEQRLPPKGAVRIEELINYFSYDYPQPQGDAPFLATMEVAACPWTPAHRLVRIGLKGREIAKDKRPASNLVFLIDVSGSMQPANKLPLLKQSLGLLIDQLGSEDQVAMAVYAGSSGTVLEPTRSKAKMRAALAKLESGGSTNGASGVQLAYELAERGFIKGGTNRVILATDGDWNVGITDPKELLEMIAKKAKGGVFLTVLGYGMDNLKDSMLVKLADKGNGNYGYIDTLIEAKKLLADELSSTLVTIAKDVKIQVEFNPAQVSGYRLIGYEKRLLAKEDFNDDTKDAGEIGAGHTVTALYEVVPAGGDVPQFAKTDELKYQRPARDPEKSEIRNPKSETSPELLTLKLRYKAPDGDVSKLLEFPLTDTGATWEKSSRDFRFAAAVAGYGMLLRDSPHKGTATWNSVRELAVEGTGEDATGYRAEFITLLEKAKALAR